MNFIYLIETFQSDMLTQKVDSQEMTLRYDGAIQILEKLRQEVINIQEQEDGQRVSAAETPAHEAPKPRRGRAKKTPTAKS